MRIFFILSTISFLSVPVPSFGMDFETANIAWNKQKTENDPARMKYLIERMEYGNSISLDEKNNCYSKPGGGITQIVIINKDGVIEKIVSNIENEKSECFKGVYMGTKFKAPPFAPIYDKMLMGYGIEP